MRKLLLTMIMVLLAATGAFSMSFDVGNNKVDAYASLRAFTIFNNTQKGDVRTRNVSQFTLGLQPNSRMGVRWTQGDIFVHAEMGMGGPVAGQSGANGDVYLRLLYGDYKFAGGEKGRIRIGQIATIANTHTLYERKLSQDNGLQGFGTLMEQRRFGINYEIGGFSISAISMRQDQNTVRTLFDGADFSEIMPRIEAAYTITPSLKVVGTYVKSSVVGVDGASSDNYKRYHVDAGHIAAIASPKIGDKARLIASGFYSVNGGIYQMVSTGTGFNDYEAVNRSDWYRTLPELKEAGDLGSGWNNKTVYGGAVAVTVDAFEAGFGIQSASNDLARDNKTGIGIYANYKFRVANNFRITPEVGYLYTGKIPEPKGSTSDALKDTKGLQIGIQFRFDI